MLLLCTRLCTKDNAQIAAINAAYATQFPGRVLEKDIVSETSGHFKRLLVSCCQGNRDESTTVNVEKAKKEAQQIFDAGEKKWGTDESVFNKILQLRSRPQLYASLSCRRIFIPHRESRAG
jgi:annexin A7/11